MDETGQPGGAVPTTYEGAEPFGSGSRPQGWAPAGLESLAGASTYAASPNGVNGSAWRDGTSASGSIYQASPAYAGHSSSSGYPDGSGNPTSGGYASDGFHQSSLDYSTQSDYSPQPSTNEYPMGGPPSAGESYGHGPVDPLDVTTGFPAIEQNNLSGVPAPGLSAAQRATSARLAEPESPVRFPPVARTSAPLPPGHVSLFERTPQRDTPAMPSQRETHTMPGQHSTAAMPGQRDLSAMPGQRDAGMMPGQRDAATMPAEGRDTLPQRVPAEPDVPALPEPVTVDDPRAEDPELARIASYLRYDDQGDDQTAARKDSFDVEAMLAAVQQVAGVRGAQLRRNPGGVHTLRLELADGADPALVSRAVARLLNERMGLAAAVGGPGEHRGLYRSGGIDPVRAARAESAFSALAETARSEIDARRQTIGAVSRQRERPHQPLPPRRPDARRVVIENVSVSTHGLNAEVEVRLLFGKRHAVGSVAGPAVDGYVLRLAALAAAAAVDQLLAEVGKGNQARCFVEHATVLRLGGCELAAVVLLLVCDGWVEQLAGCALVGADPRQAIVRATLAAVNRRLESLLS